MVWPELGVFVVFALAAQGLGRGLTAGLHLADGRSRFLWSQALGLAGLIALAWLLSLADWLRPWPVGSALALLAAGGLFSLAKDRPRITPVEPLSGWEKLFLAGVAFHLFIGLVQALSPPVWGDGLHYLFVLARDYGREGAVTFQPYIYASRPQNMVLLFALVQLFGQAEAAQLISWWFGLLSVVAIAALTTRAADRRSGLMAAFIVAATPIYGQLNGRGMSGLGVIFFGLMGLWALRSAFAAPSRRATWAALAGLCLGLAAGFKVIGLTALALGLILAAAETLRRKRGLTAAIILAAAGLAAAGPWYVYSYLHTGSIFYQGGALTGRLAAADRARWLVEPKSKPKPVRVEAAAKTATAKKKITPSPRPAPKAAARKQPSRLAKQVRYILGLAAKPGHNPLTGLWRINTLSGHRHRVVGLFILVLTPLLFLIRPVNRSVVWLVLAGALQAGLVVLVFGPYARYALLGLTLMAAGAATAWWGLVRIGGWAKGLAIAILVVGWGAVLPQAGYGLWRDLPAATGLTDRRAYLNRMFPRAMPVFEWADKNLPERAKVLVFAEGKRYFLNRAFVVATPNQNPLFDYERFAGPSDLARAARAVGASHALINFQDSDNAWDVRAIPWLRRYRDLVRAWAKTLKPLFSNGPIGLYEIPRNE